MNKENISILVVGAGAVGGIIAALLRKDGYNVEIICNHDDYADLIRSQGLKISGVLGKFIIKVPAYSSPDMISDKKDVILLATKTPDMVNAAKSVLPYLKEDGHMVLLQNGLFEEELSVLTENKKTVGCVIGWGATMEKYGDLFMSSRGDFILGYHNGKPDKFLADLVSIFSSIVPSRTTDNFVGHQYAKLIINSCITSLGAICGLFLGEMLYRKKIRNIFIEVMNEAVNVADALNIRVEVFGGRLNFYKFLNGTGKFSVFRRHLIIMIIGFKYRKLKSSSLQSLAKSKPTEIEYLNGYIVRNGNKKSISVPVNEAIVTMIHEIENKRRIISESNFDDPIFDSFN